MKQLVFVVLFLGASAWADIPVEEPVAMPDMSCVGKKAGDACTGGGTCRPVRARRPVLEAGATVPSWTWVEVLVCEQPSGEPSAASRAWLGAALAFLALLLGLGLRRPARPVTS